MAELRLAQQATPATPPSGSNVVFVDVADGVPKVVDDAGVVKPFQVGASGQVIISRAFPIDHTMDAALAAGVTITGYTPAAGDIIALAFFDLLTLFNGTTPLFDLQFENDPVGLLREFNGAALLQPVAVPTMPYDVGYHFYQVSSAAVGPGNLGLWLATNTALELMAGSGNLQVVMSQDGTRGGDADRLNGRTGTRPGVDTSAHLTITPVLSTDSILRDFLHWFSEYFLLTMTGCNEFELH